MNSPAAAFKAALESTVRNAVGLAAAMGHDVVKLYTERPENAPGAYIVDADYTETLEATDCGTEAEAFQTLEWFTRKSDMGAQARAMGAILVAALVAELTIAGWDCVVTELEDHAYRTAPDRATRGRLVVRYELSESAA